MAAEAEEAAAVAVAAEGEAAVAAAPGAVAAAAAVEDTKAACGTAGKGAAAEAAAVASGAAAAAAVAAAAEEEGALAAAAAAAKAAAGAFEAAAAVLAGRATGVGAVPAAAAVGRGWARRGVCEQRRAGAQGGRQGAARACHGKHGPLDPSTDSLEVKMPGAGARMGSGRRAPSALGGGRLGLALSQPQGAAARRAGHSSHFEHLSQNERGWEGAGGGNSPPLLAWDAPQGSHEANRRSRRQAHHIVTTISSWAARAHSSQRGVRAGGSWQLRRVRRGRLCLPSTLQASWCANVPKCGCRLHMAVLAYRRRRSQRFGRVFQPAGDL